MDFLTASFWFRLVPRWNGVTLRVFFIVFIVFVLFGALVRMISKKRIQDRFTLEVVRRVAVLFVTTGILGVAYWFFAWQQIPLFASRFWLLVGLAGVLWYAWEIWKFAKKTVPAERERLHQNKEQRKYFY